MAWVLPRFGCGTRAGPVGLANERSRSALGDAMITADETKRLLKLHGQIRPQPASDWNGTLPLPSAVERFYREIGPFNIAIKAQAGTPIFCRASLASGNFKPATAGTD